jgi:hypothetical protein
MRYCDESFPAYRHRPGTTPHPIRDPEGHSYGKESAPAFIDEGSWSDCRAYLFAIDLFNHGYYWEAHEELEALWLGVGRNSPAGRFLQGIIQAAAALLKLEAAKLESADRLLTAASAKLREPSQPFLGLDGGKLADDLENAIRSADPRVAVICLAATP